MTNYLSNEIDIFLILEEYYRNYWRALRACVE